MTSRFDQMLARRRLRRDGMWNPHSPDNMLVRSDALRAGKADPLTFAAHQKRIAKLAHKRLRMQRRGELPVPTAVELAAFDAACRARGLEPPS